MEIKVEKLPYDRIQELEIEDWPVWTKEPSVFDWYYDEQEKCLFLEGHVIVKHDGRETEISKGDFVTFPKGMKCVWEVIEPVRKHYKFG